MAAMTSSRAAAATFAGSDRSEGRTLLVLPALAARAGASAGGGGGFVLTRKFIDGVGQYVRHWPGRVRVAVERDDRLGSNLDEIEVHPESLDFDLQWMPGETGLRDLLRNARVVLASLVDKHVDLPAACAATEGAGALVYISEYSLLTRRQIIRTETANPILRWRRERWTAGLEKRYRKAIAEAAGVQCNGTPTHEAYKGISPNAFLYFDTRVRADQLADAASLERRFDHLLAGKPLRLCFSGRLIAMKGADHLPRVAAALARLGVAFTMDICGGGALEANVRETIASAGLESKVRLRGVLDFQSELMPFVRDQVDLFVCCHRQGDPSCTYLETMSCGTPIAGYDNEAFAGVVKTSEAGWTSPMDQPEALASVIAELDRDRPALFTAARASLEFAKGHTFEHTMRRRVEHMLACAEASHAGAGAP